MTLDSIRHHPQALCKSPAASSSGGSSSGRSFDGCRTLPFLNWACVLGDSSTAPPPPQSNGHLYLDSHSPSPPYLHKHKHLHNDTLKPSVDPPAAPIPPPLTSHHEKPELTEVQLSRKLQTLQNGLVAPPQKKEPGSVQNGRSQPWERFMPEAFAQHFHQAVLQSTHNKG